jgi:hypothetical protein
LTPKLENFKSNTNLIEYEKNESRHNTWYNRVIGYLSYFDWGLRFFSKRKQAHYKVLDTYVFSLLSKDLIKKGHHHQIGTSFSYYIDMVPANNEHYSDAVEHMKKDKNKNRLPELIDQYRIQIKKVNEITANNGDLIVNQISIKCSLDPETGIMRDVFTFLNYSLGKIKDNQEIHEWTNSDHSGFVPHPNDPDYGQVIDCANKLIKDEVILHSFDEIRQNSKNLEEIATKIQNQASSISQSIGDEDYHTNAKCCPSFITILKDLFNRN